MPAIARVVGKDKKGGDLMITVRVTGVGQPDEGGMPKRAKLRALIASGMVPDNLTGGRQENKVEKVNMDVSRDFEKERRMNVDTSVDRREEFDMSMDKEIASEGNIDDVKRALDVVKEFGTFAQLTEINEMDSKQVVGLTPIKNVFGKGFADIVSTAEYKYRITTKYSF